MDIVLIYITLLGDDWLVIWDFKSGTRLYKFPIYASPSAITALAFVAGDKFLLTGVDNNDSTLTLCNLLNGECIEKFHFDQDVRAIACAANGMVCVGLKGGRVCFLRFNNLSSHSGMEFGIQIYFCS